MMLLEGYDLPTIDLHSFTNPHEAIEQLEKELFSFYTKDESHIRIIHGIGIGVLRDAVHEVLEKNPLVREWHEEGSGGSCVVRL